MADRYSPSKVAKAITRLVANNQLASPNEDVEVQAWNREALATELLAYGEDTVASRISSATVDELNEIHKRGREIAFSGEEINLLRAQCLAAIKVLEGAARPLARKRRKSRG